MPQRGTIVRVKVFSGNTPWTALSVVALAVVAFACRMESSKPRVKPAPAHGEAALTSAEIDTSPGEEIPSPSDEIELLAIDGDVPAYVVRGNEGKPVRGVFLGGSCTHPRASLEVLRRVANEHGAIVGLQGDQPCPGGDASLRKFSSDTLVLEKRIKAALAVAGSTGDAPITVIGYSQGAERAEWLANASHTRGGETFTRFVLVAGPIVPQPSRFAHAHGVVALAGPGDVRENMAVGARRLHARTIPAIYMEMPSHHHQELDPAAAETLAGAFEWLEANARPPHTGTTTQRKAMVPASGARALPAGRSIKR